MLLITFMQMAATSLHHHHHQQHHRSSHRHHEPLKLINRDGTGSLIGDEIFYSWQQSSIVGKRKSAVELLQETKPLYVKSETVLDRKQQLGRNYFSSSAGHLEDEDNLLYSYISGNTAAPATCPAFGSASSRTFAMYHSSPSNNCNGNNSNCEPYNQSNHYNTSTLPIPKSPKLIPPPAAFRKSTGSFQLQNNLRKLLNISKDDLLDTKENFSEFSDNRSAGTTGHHRDNSSDKLLIRNSSSLSKRSSKPRCQHIIINSTCHKSLPDLSSNNVSNVHDNRNSPVRRNADERCHLSLFYDSADGPSKSEYQKNSVSTPTCKNVVTFFKNDANHMANSRDDDVKDEETDDDVLLSESNQELPWTDVISPPSLYSDFKIEDALRSGIGDCSKARPVLRSKSDAGERSRLPALPANVADVSKEVPANVDEFFDHLGMNSDEFSELTAARPSSSSPPVFFWSGSSSSVDSIGDYNAGGDLNSTNYNGNSNVELPSIVERNARIIKWLCNCRKAMNNNCSASDASGRHVSR